MSAAVKTNAVREAERLKISVTTVEYDVDESDLSAVHAAESSAIPLERIYKTLVLRDCAHVRDLVVAVIPGAKELDLKKLAVLAGKGKLEMVHVKELLALTGYVRGGCSPLGMKKKLPTFVDESALKFDTVSVSAGRRGLQMLLPPRDLIRAVGAKTGAIARDPVQEEDKSW